ncbi:signal transduction histidine-protein kinase/phosphatase DegS [Halolactibacillus miurensis]|uniref:Signal transduction histidine-protein kinase/phosphatase DegS n=1 Tax=Halolactibacillus miurensis TaxID=306541 RepID=A0A1I6TL94_9BACI|nr:MULTISPECIES: sensor histidine kinase [Halolactibacillus]GEM04743.1 signal transduction histidine-protein kinase/phosphatase DegS [Halolactibacillus miurensis]SFS90023.1 two-component system, NarL family, sensor histidine kinase DegS [Halolactibacillus miurensis]
MKKNHNKHASHKKHARADLKGLDDIIDEMVEAVHNSKDEIYNITEQARLEYETLTEKIAQLREEIENIIKESDLLERKERVARQRLAKVSENFSMYSEQEIQEVYETAHNLQVEYRMKQEREQTLRKERDDIERRLRTIDETIERAESLVGKVSIVLNYLTDDFKEITSLIKDAKEKQMFGLKIIEAQEEERRRISREIHDGPAQMLANVLIRADIVDRTYRERSPEEALVEIKSMRKMVRQSLYEVRRIIYDLRPMALDDLGLVPTIRKYLQTIGEYHDIEIHFQEQSNQERLEEKYEVAIFRLTQEAVQNAIKHAEASEIDVKLIVTNNRVNVSVKDDGKGFTLGETKSQSFGLIGMRERVDMLEGTLELTSKPGKGTHVFINIPLTN